MNSIRSLEGLTLTTMSQSWTRGQEKLFGSWFECQWIWLKQIPGFPETTPHPLKCSLLYLKPFPFYCFILVGIYTCSPLAKIWKQPNSHTNLPSSQIYPRYYITSFHTSGKLFTLFQIILWHHWSALLCICSQFHYFLLHSFTLPILLFSLFRQFCFPTY